MQSSQSNNSCPPDAARGCYGEIAEIIASTRGLYWQQTKGTGDSHTLNTIWGALGEMAEDLLLRKKSVIILDFLHASIKIEKVTYYGREQANHKPQLVLLPDFTAKFHLHNVLVMKDAHYHATVPAQVSYTAIGALLGIDRFIVEAAVKDSIREIGKYIQRNPLQTLTIDVGFAALEFRGREYRIKWAPRFFGCLTTVVGARSLVTPYDPPSMTVGGPEAACRFDAGQLTHSELHHAVADTIDAESRVSAVEMNDGRGGSSYRKTNY